jgi:hypothetical protein
LQAFTQERRENFFSLISPHPVRKSFHAMADHCPEMERRGGAKRALLKAGRPILLFLRNIFGGPGHRQRDQACDTSPEVGYNEDRHDALHKDGKRRSQEAVE